MKIQIGLIGAGTCALDIYAAGLSRHETICFTTVAECDPMMEMVQKRNLLLTVYHNRRWDCGFRTVRNTIDEGLLGQVFSLQAHSFTFGCYQGATDWRLKEGGGFVAQADGTQSARISRECLRRVLGS